MGQSCYFVLKPKVLLLGYRLNCTSQKYVVLLTLGHRLHQVHILQVFFGRKAYLKMNADTVLRHKCALISAHIIGGSISC